MRFLLLLSLSLLAMPINGYSCTEECKEKGECTYSFQFKRCVPTKPEHCSESIGCKEGGYCTLELANSKHRLNLNTCVIDKDEDCRQSERCEIFGLCRYHPNEGCIPSSESCLKSTICKEDGNCGYNPEKQKCKPRNEDDCRKSERCKKQGFCNLNRFATFGPSCDPISQSDCDVGCKEFGTCVFVRGHCKPTKAKHCLRSKACKKYGLCRHTSGECEAGTTADCRKTKYCKKKGLCKWSKSAGRCVKR